MFKDSACSNNDTVIQLADGIKIVIDYNKVKNVHLEKVNNNHIYTFTLEDMTQYQYRYLEKSFTFLCNENAKK